MPLPGIACNINILATLEPKFSRERTLCHWIALTAAVFRGAKGNTALHIAVKSACVSMVKALLVFEADTAARNEDGETAWQLAKRKWDASGVMDVMKDREGVLFAMHAVGAEGVDTEPGKCALHSIHQG